MGLHFPNTCYALEFAMKNGLSFVRVPMMPYNAVYVVSSLGIGTEPESISGRSLHLGATFPVL